MRSMLLALLAVPAAAGRFPDCVHVAKGSPEIQPSLEALLECQQKAKDKLAKTLSAEKLERLEDHQRAEAKRWVESGAAPTDYTKAPAGGSELPDEGKTPPKKRKRDKQPLEANDKDMAVAAGLDEAGLKDLEERAKASAGPGGAFTPATAKMMLDSIARQQKDGASDEMRGLLEAVAGDGANLSPATLQKLQDAARGAKGQGLELGLEPGQEKSLLDGYGQPPAAPPRD